MLGNVTASLGMAVRLAQLQDAGRSATSTRPWPSRSCTLADAGDRRAGPGRCSAATASCWSTTSAGFFADAEALYSYEGTREINTLIVGRAVTGLGAFT